MDDGQDTKRYLQDFDRVQKTAASDEELFDQMTELYPHWVACSDSRSHNPHQPLTRIIGE